MSQRMALGISVDKRAPLLISYARSLSDLRRAVLAAPPHANLADLNDPGGLSTVNPSDAADLSEPRHPRSRTSTASVSTC